MSVYLAPLASVVLVITGLFLLRVAARWRAKAAESEGWPTVAGIIIDRQLFEPTGVGARTGYSLYVDYEYSIGSETYRGDRLAYYQVAGKERVMELYGRFYEGAEIEVFYNPKSHKESVLVPGINPDKPYHEFAMGVLAIIAGVVVGFGNWDKFLRIREMLDPIL